MYHSLLKTNFIRNGNLQPIKIFTKWSRNNKCFFATQSSLKSALDKKSIQFTSKQLKESLMSKDVVFYEAPPGIKRTFMWLYISAGVQLMFWGNLGSLAYAAYSTTEGEGEDAPVVLAPKGKRMAIAGALVGTGIAVASLMCLYPWRYIDKLVLLKGANTVRLLTHAKFIKSHQIKEYPIEQLYCKQKVFTGVGKKGTDAVGTQANSSHIFLNAKGEKIAYMLDRKGSFMDSKLFDGLWYNSHGK